LIINAVFIVNNFLSHGISNLALTNARQVIDGLWIFPFFYRISLSYDKVDISFIAKHLSKVLNIYFWINVPIIIVEFITKSFIVNRFLKYNPAVYDSTT